MPARSSRSRRRSSPRALCRSPLRVPPAVAKRAGAFGLARIGACRTVEELLAAASGRDTPVSDRPRFWCAALWAAGPWDRRASRAALRSFGDVSVQVAFAEHLVPAARRLQLLRELLRLTREAIAAGMARSEGPATTTDEGDRDGSANDMSVEDWLRWVSKAVTSVPRGAFRRAADTRGLWAFWCWFERSAHGHWRDAGRRWLAEALVSIPALPRHQRRALFGVLRELTPFGASAWVRGVPTPFWCRETLRLAADAPEIHDALRRVYFYTPATHGVPAIQDFVRPFVTSKVGMLPWLRVEDFAARCGPEVVIEVAHRLAPRSLSGDDRRLRTFLEEHLLHRLAITPEQLADVLHLARGAVHDGIVEWVIPRLSPPRSSEDEAATRPPRRQAATSRVV